jgi:hypothetical protein
MELALAVTELEIRYSHSGTVAKAGNQDSSQPQASSCAGDSDADSTNPTTPGATTDC